MYLLRTGDVRKFRAKFIFGNGHIEKVDGSRLFPLEVDGTFYLVMLNGEKVALLVELPDFGRDAAQ